MRKHKSSFRILSMLDYLANAPDGDIMVSADELSAMFACDKKTVRRDLMALSDLGWVQFERIPAFKLPRKTRAELNKPVVARIRRMRERRPKISTVPILMPKIQTDACNQCGYEFQRRPNGMIDMRDFRAHKESHYVAVN